MSKKVKPLIDLKKIINKFTKKQWIAIGVTAVIILGSTYFILHRFRGDFSIVSGGGEEKSGTYYTLNLDNGKKIKIAKNNKLVLSKIYKESSDDKFKKASFNTFAEDLKTKVVSVRKNWAGDIQYKVSLPSDTEYEELNSFRGIYTTLENNKIVVHELNSEPKNSNYLYINFNTNETSGDKIEDSEEYELSDSGTIEITIPDNYKGNIDELIVNVTNAIRSIYDIADLDDIERKE